MGIGRAAKAQVFPVSWSERGLNGDRGGRLGGCGCGFRAQPTSSLPSAHGIADAVPVVLIPQQEGGCFVQCPTLSGCYSQGESVEESLANIREAIELAIEDRNAPGQTIPSSGPAIITEVTIAA